MNYIDINFEEVRGFNNLTKEQQDTFRNTYKLHNSVQGNDYKEEWIPISVESIENHLKVVFRNGIWLHYTQRGDWY